MSSIDRRFGLRRLLRWLTAVAGVVALTFAVLLLAPVQRALLRHSLASSGATGIQLGYFHATPFGFATEQMEFTRGPLHVDARGLIVVLRPRGFLHPRIEVTKMSAKNVDLSWDLDLAAQQAAKAVSPEAQRTKPPFPGFLHTLHAPFPLTLDVADLAGRLRLLHGDSVFAEGRWDLQGGHFAPGGTGSLHYRIDVTGAALPSGGTARIEGAIGASVSASGELLGLEINGGAGVQEGSLASWPMSFGLEVTANPGGESYRARAAFGPDLKAEATGGFSPASRVLQAHVDFLSGPSLDARLPSLKPLLEATRSFKGSLDAAFLTDGPHWTATRAVAQLGGGPTAALIRLDLTPSQAPAGQPGPLATLRIEHFPVSWTNSWLAASGVRLDSCEMAGAWNINLSGNRVDFVPSEPLTVAPLRIGGPRFQWIGALRLQADPRIEVSKTGARILVENLHIENGLGRQIDLATDVALGWGGAPSVKLNKFEMSAKRAAGEKPLLTLQLLHPLDLDPSNMVSGLEKAPPGDLVRLKAQGLPLGWLSAFLPGRVIEGRLVQGESLVRSIAGQGLVLSTTSPWRIEGLRFAEGGREYFHGSLQLAPAAVYGPEERWMRIVQIEAQDVRGYRLKGRMGTGFKSKNDRMGGAVVLEAELPFAPAAEPDLGPLRVSLSALAHVSPGGKGELAHLALTVVDAKDTKLFSVLSDQPVSVERTEEAEWLVSSTQPLRFITGKLPLEWLNPYLAPRKIAITGVIPPTELQLLFSRRRIQLESKAPLAVEDFHLERGGAVLIDRAQLHCGMSLDLGLEHRLLPVFKMKSTASFRITYGLIDAGGSHVARFDGQIDASATERSGALHNITGGLWVDLGALGRMPFLAQARLPAKGELRGWIKKSTDKAHTVEFEGWVERLVGRDGAAAPSLTISGRAGSDYTQRIGGFGVKATLLSSPRPSDLRFGMRIDYKSLSIPDLSSKLEGSYVDLDAVRKFAAAFDPQPQKKGPSRSPDAAPPPAEKSPQTSSVPSAGAKSMLARAGAVMRPPDSPPWGNLRGHFTLAIKTVALPPYTIENLAGRLDATADSIALNNLSGDIFGGRWSADISTKFLRDGSENNETFDAHFRLTQLDAGRAVRMRFPNPAAGIDGRLDLDLLLSSRASRWTDLVSRSTGTFSLTGHGARVHVTLPKEEMMSNALLVAGAMTFSSEMRALGHFVQRLSDVPIDQLQASGNLTADGQLELERLQLQSPEIRLVAVGRVANAKTRDLMSQPLSAQATLDARGNLAVILAGMHLLRPAGADGYRPMNQTFLVAGNVGQPDFHPLYDLLARAVEGSHGSWGMLMRKIQTGVNKHRTNPDKPVTPAREDGLRASRN